MCFQYNCTLSWQTKTLFLYLAILFLLSSLGKSVGACRPISPIKLQAGSTAWSFLFLHMGSGWAGSVGWKQVCRGTSAVPTACAAPQSAWRRSAEASAMATPPRWRPCVSQLRLFSWSVDSGSLMPSSWHLHDLFIWIFMDWSAVIDYVTCWTWVIYEERLWVRSQIGNSMNGWLMLIDPVLQWVI